MPPLPSRYCPLLRTALPPLPPAAAHPARLTASSPVLALAFFRRSVDKVTAALAAVDKKAADFRKGLPPKPIAEGLLHYVKKQAWEK